MSCSHTYVAMVCRYCSGHDALRTQLAQRDAEIERLQNALTATQQAESFARERYAADIDELRAELSAAQSELSDLRTLHASEQRSLERHRHNATIEGDDVCPYQLQWEAAQPIVEAVRELGRRLRAYREGTLTLRAESGLGFGVHDGIAYGAIHDQEMELRKLADALAAESEGT